MDWGFCQNEWPHVHVRKLVDLPKEVTQCGAEYDEQGGYYFFPRADDIPRASDEAYGALIKLLDQSSIPYVVKTIKVTWE